MESILSQLTCLTSLVPYVSVRVSRINADSFDSGVDRQGIYTWRVTFIGAPKDFPKMAVHRQDLIGGTESSLPEVTVEVESSSSSSSAATATAAGVTLTLTLTPTLTLNPEP